MERWIRTRDQDTRTIIGALEFEGSIDEATARVMSGPASTIRSVAVIASDGIAAIGRLTKPALEPILILCCQRSGV